MNTDPSSNHHLAAKEEEEEEGQKKTWLHKKLAPTPKTPNQQPQRRQPVENRKGKENHRGAWPSPDPQHNQV